MAEQQSAQQGGIRFEDSPMAWFGELILAKDRGNFRRAVEAQSELKRLGWNVEYRKPRQAVGGAK